MTLNNTRDNGITLYRRIITEAHATPLLSAMQERRLAQRIDTARRRLLAALAVWPSCIPAVIDNYAKAGANDRQRGYVIAGLQNGHPGAPSGLLASNARVAAQLEQLESAHRQYLESLAVNGWCHAHTLRRRRAAAAQLCGLRLHDHCLRYLLTLPETEPCPEFELPYASVRARITTARRALETEKHRMVSANLRLVASIARRYRYCDVAQVDLIQEGNIGLLRAVEKFDHRRGFKFSTYAIWWIQRAMVLAITLQRSTLSVPAYALQAALRAQRRTAQHLLLGEPAPSFESLATIETISAADLRAACAASLPSVSLHGDSDDETALIHTLRDNRQPDPADIMMQSQLRQQLHTVLDKLPARQAHVLRLRYGIGVDEPHTLDAIGQQLGLSRERIRQIELQALSQLRTHAHSAHLDHLLEDACEWRPHYSPTDGPFRDSTS